jgi:hypothetical protein
MQIETAATKATEALHNAYGPLAFGTIVLIVVCILLIVTWKYVGMPTLTTILQISQNFSETTHNIIVITTTQKEISEDLKLYAERTKAQHDRFDQLMADARERFRKQDQEA